MLRYKKETRPGLVALYDIWPGNWAGQFLQPRSPHGAITGSKLYYSTFAAITAMLNHTHNCCSVTTDNNRTFIHSLTSSPTSAMISLVPETNVSCIRPQNQLLTTMLYSPAIINIQHCSSLLAAVYRQVAFHTWANSSFARPELWISTRQLCASRIRLWRNAQMPSCTIARLYRIWDTTATLRHVHGQRGQHISS